jgi:putative tryptophan/tyrosine transport system substrate-binding protein
VKRREFITLLGGAAVLPLLRPIAARAQQPAMPVIGFLSSGGTPNPNTLTALRKGLDEMGFVEGRNVTIEVRGAESYEQLPVLAAELVRRAVAVIFAWGTANSALAAKAATTTIPVVFANGSDPVRSGIVASLNRPGGNLTGVSFYNSALVAKRLEVLRELVPVASTIGFLNNPTIQTSRQNVADLQAATAAIGVRMVLLNASTEGEINAAFSAAAEGHVDALLVGPDATFNVRRAQIASLAASYRIPANHPSRIYAEAGGLSSYGDLRAESERQAGIYIGRVLKGEKPADLPVQQPTKFELAINLKAAKALGLEVPPMLLARADEVIE